MSSDRPGRELIEAPVGIGSGADPDTGAADDPQSVPDLAPTTPTDLRASLRQLRAQTRGSTFAFKLVLLGALLGGGVTLALRPEIWCRVVGTILIGAMFAHATELQHQAIHNIAFRRQRLNTVWGIVLGLPMAISFAAYRASHLRHHRYLGTPMNREFFDYGDQYGAGTGRSAALSWFVRFSMVHHYGGVFRGIAIALRGGDHPDETRTTSRRIRRDHLLILALAAVLVAVSVLTGRAIVLWVWLLPLVLVAAPVHAVIELPEHFRCETEDPDPFRNTRTLRSNRVASWFTNGNNFHVEHHLMPNLQIERLPLLHARIQDRLVHVNTGYVDYFRGLLRREP
jgi:fatty acid desaturase